MNITLVIGAAAAIFIIGIIFVAKGIVAEEKEAVPISSPEEIAELKSVFSPAKNKPPVQLSQPLNYDAADHIPRPLDSAPSLDKVSQDKIDQIAAENAQLIKRLAEQKDRVGQLEGNIEELKNKYNSTKDSNSEAITALEQQVARFQQEKDKLIMGRELVDELKSKNEVLKNQYAENQRQQAELRLIIGRLEQEKNDLIKFQHARGERSDLDNMSNRLAGSIATIEVLKSENKELKDACQKLEAAFKKFESFNAHLLEKEKLIQYELVKSRAQAMGLEKICEDFKTQIEHMSAEAAAA